MGVIHVENVDEKTMQSLRLRAAGNGRTLEEEVRALIGEGVADDSQLALEARVADAARIRALTKGYSAETDSVRIIRDLRDRDR